MNSEEDLTCLHCKKNFTEENPPRMLTMCGHTFCDACIKSLIVRKKINNKYKLVCPEDKTAIDLSSNNTSFFPKNIALLKILEHKSKNTEIKNKSVLSSIRLSNIDIQKLKSEESSLTYDL
jgi:hypothetical protein